MTSKDSTSLLRSPRPASPGAFLVGDITPHHSLPESDPTIGYQLNHFMLRIRDPARSLHFYTNLMGMQLVFTFHGGPFTVYYLGYPQTAGDRSDLRAWAAKLTAPGVLPKTLGFLELKHIHGSERPVEEGGYEVVTGNQPPHLGFGHLGFTVPDVRQAVERLRGQGVEVMKDLGVAEREHIPLTRWEEDRGVGTGQLHPNYRKTFYHVALVKDPDGYIVELLPQTL
ncbi:hypothetical protein AbraIFM66951_009041 [Aspergillus brasiliensis]|uniref:VOC domain-containing protein n=1 Tax=Aspergillus brasiliensis TaxID=319629 RepID=A0A9W6DJ51_9EURO|nr:hypothetical protein AbraCBS73388_007278 [Aspergillus brasiliensis]GKZ46141.1 hypothetical protein AbraIFM66951_009041 [Aspergillus brasiliensis]